MSKLTAAERNKLGPDQFAIPGKRAYPIHDINHARNALARVAQNGTPEEQAKVKRAVHKKYPQLADKEDAADAKKPGDKKEDAKGN